MRIIKTVIDIVQIRKLLKGSIGFIPTMGCLHQGHISLVTKAKQENDHVIVSIFVNPTQFGPHDDYKKYPRDIERDLELLKKAHTDFVFLPQVEEMYPLGYETYIHVKNLANRLEGKSRPGHFDGVATIITKLFNIIRPTRAYFGQKDAQQVVVIKKMIADLNIPVKLVIGKTVRESDGLAMSSRNVYLNKKERQQAVVLYQSLLIAQKLFKEGIYESKKIKLAMKNLINTTSGIIDYISIADPQLLLELKRVKKGALVSLAVCFDKTRLIDNIIL